MSEFIRRTMVTLPAELESDIARAKETYFLRCTQAEMFRHLIRLGLLSVQKSKAARTCNTREINRSPGHS